MLFHHDRGQLIFFYALLNLLCRTQLLLLEGIRHHYCLVLLPMLRVVLGGLLARAHHLRWVVLVHGFAGRVRKEIPSALFRALLLRHCPLLLSSLFLRHRFLERRSGRALIQHNGWCLLCWNGLLLLLIVNLRDLLDTIRQLPMRTLIHIVEVDYDLARLIVELAPNLLVIVVDRRLIRDAGG